MQSFLSTARVHYRKPPAFFIIVCYFYYISVIPVILIVQTLIKRFAVSKAHVVHALIVTFASWSPTSSPTAM